MERKHPVPKLATELASSELSKEDESDGLKCKI
jgi:hypothetical protein